MASPDLVDAVLSDDGWAYASTPPVDDTDPGRFHALFGRDSLIFALQMLPDRPDIAAATLRALAAKQGTRDDEETAEEPGKILHEFRTTIPQRLADGRWPVRHGQLLYYGSADSTSWFLVVLAATHDAALIGELNDAWVAASVWLQTALDRGGGLVWHGPNPGKLGLEQQGWRDSQSPVTDGNGGGILRADGTAPVPPLADVDSQAVAVAALRSLALLDHERANHWQDQLVAMRSRLSRRLPAGHDGVGGRRARGDGGGVAARWLLWADALTAPASRAAAARLVQPDVLTDYGLRTLASSHPQFSSHAYHRGAVWPFDCWLGWGLCAPAAGSRKPSGYAAEFSRQSRAWGTRLSCTR